MRDAPDPLADFVDLLEQDAAWREPSAFHWRADAADRLDLLLATAAHGACVLRAHRMLDAMAAADEALFTALRLSIRAGRGREVLAPWLDVGEPVGQHYDALDSLVAGMFALHEPLLAQPRLPADMVFYQPTPARHIVHAVRKAGLSAGDHVLDLGSGLGHVPLLARVLSGASVSGVEREPAYVACATDAALRLGIDVTFACADARQADYTQASVFYLFTPFIGTVLRDVVARIEAEARRRVVRVVALGPCTRTFARQRWLRTDAPNPEVSDQIVVFTSHP